MKVLVIIPSYKPAFIYGGPVRSVAALCEALVQAGNVVTVMTTNANGKQNLSIVPGKEMLVDNVQVYYFARWTGDHSNFSPSLLRAFWQQCKQYDVIHIHSWWNMVTMPVMVICALRKIIPVLSPRGSITAYTMMHQKSWLKNLFHKLLGHRLLKKAIIHVTTKQELRDIEAIIRLKATYIIPNILPLHTPVRLNQYDSSELKLLYLGRIDPKKNIEFLFDTLLENFNVPFSLEIVGDGEPHYIDELKKKSTVVNSIHWGGPIHTEDKWKKLAAADLLVLPSFNENYGNVIIESLSQGTPVLISDQVGLKDFVQENQLGWVMECDPVKWKQLLHQIWEDRESRAIIRTRGPQVIQQHFNTTILTNAYESMYEDLHHLQTIS